MLQSDMDECERTITMRLLQIAILPVSSVDGQKPPTELFLGDNGRVFPVSVKLKIANIASTISQGDASLCDYASHFMPINGTAQATPDRAGQLPLQVRQNHLVCCDDLL